MQLCEPGTFVRESFAGLIDRGKPELPTMELVPAVAAAPAASPEKEKPGKPSAAKKERSGIKVPDISKAKKRFK